MNQLYQGVTVSSDSELLRVSGMTTGGFVNTKVAVVIIVMIAISKFDNLVKDSFYHIGHTHIKNNNHSKHNKK